jgi:hypothetical protein
MVPQELLKDWRGGEMDAMATVSMAIPKPSQSWQAVLDSYTEFRTCAAHAGRTLRPAGLTGGAMMRRAYTQRSLVEVLLPDGDKLWDPTLRRIDTILDDEELVGQ